MEPEKTKQSASNEGTPTEQSQTASQTGNNVNAEQQVTASSPAPVSNEGNDSTQRNIEAEKGKMSALEKERNDYKKQVDDLTPAANTYKNIEDTFRNNKDAYESFRKAWKKKSGKDLGDYETAYNIQPSQEPSQEEKKSDNGQTTQQESIDPNKLRQDIVTEITMGQKVDGAFKEYVKEFPDQDPEVVKTKGYAEVEKASKQWMETVRKAQALSIDANGNQTMNFNDAVKQVTYMLPENREKYIEKIKNDGVLEGKATAYSDGAASTGGSSGSNTGVGKGNGLTDDERATLKDLPGVTEEDLLAEKNRG